MLNIYASFQNVNRTIRGRTFAGPDPGGTFAGRYHTASNNYTSTPTTAARIKNPKRVAAGKLVAERTRLAREQQKKAAAEAAVIIANNKAKATAAAPEQAPTTEDESPKSTGEKNSSLSTT